MMRLRKTSKKADSVKYCLQLNNDEMLFFPSEKHMSDYLKDYQRHVAVFRMSAFRVEFYQYN